MFALLCKSTASIRFLTQIYPPRSTLAKCTACHGFSFLVPVSSRSISWQNIQLVHECLQPVDRPHWIGKLKVNGLFSLSGKIIPFNQNTVQCRTWLRRDSSMRQACRVDEITVRTECPPYNKVLDRENKVCGSGVRWKRELRQFFIGRFLRKSDYIVFTSVSFFYFYLFTHLFFCLFAL